MSVPEVHFPLREAEVGSWDDETDVLVVGYGGAGVCAALEAVEAGADVLAVDRFLGGGDTALSGGVVYAGGGTQAQKAAGYDDSAENMFRYLRRECDGAVSDTTLHRFCDTSIDSLAWLARYGVRFGQGFWPHKTAFPPNGYHLYFSGSERTGPFDQVANPAPRGHKVHGNKMSTGDRLYRPLAESARRHGVRLRRQSRAIRLVVDEDDRVIGVECATFTSKIAARLHSALSKIVLGTSAWVSVGPIFPTYYWALRRLERYGQHGRILIRARKGLILSTGGFTWNPEMMRELAPDIAKTMPIGFDGNGSGILLGQTVGAATSNLANVGAFRMFVPPVAFGQGMLVDAAGRRSANELWYTQRVGAAMRARTGGRGYLILDSRLVAAAKAELPGLAAFVGIPARLWLTHPAKADTLTELERKLNMPAGSLQASADGVAAIAAGAPDPFGRAASDTRPLTEGPFYALDMSLCARPLPATRLSLGGLAVSEETGAVLDRTGRPIAGLFASGRAAAGICARSYVSGTALADAIFSGRRAGVAAARVNQPAGPARR